jgi:probable addiction module antidote protein
LVLNKDSMATHKDIAYRSHDDAVVEMLRADTGLAKSYLNAALAEASLPGGQFALLAALRHIAEAQGMAQVSEKAGIPRESLYRALSPKGNPTIKTLLAVMGAAGLQLAFTRHASSLAKAIAQDKAGKAKPRKLVAA